MKTRGSSHFSLFFLLFRVIVSLGSPSHAQTVEGTHGPFRYMSELDPKFPKAPYRTGHRSCPSFYSPTSARSSVAELKAVAPALGKRILERLIAQQVAHSTYLTLEMAREKFDLSCTFCRGASVFLIQEMDAMGLRLEADAVITKDLFYSFNLVKHVYIVDRNYFGEGMPLIIDPTIRQFFTRSLSKPELETVIPEIFIGTLDELRFLFDHYLKPNPNKPNITTSDVLETYLDTRSHVKIFDPSY